MNREEAEATVDKADRHHIQDTDEAYEEVLEALVVLGELAKNEDGTYSLPEDVE